jgi:alpha,alpha-trehalase
MITFSPKMRDTEHIDMSRAALDNLATESRPLLDFIEKKWADLRANARDGLHDSFADWRSLATTSTDGHLDDLDPKNPYILFLPNDFITPGGRFMVQFYWDSYFIVLALLIGDHLELAKGIVKNCLFLVEKHGMVIANRKRWAAGSQLPFLSDMVREVYRVTRDPEWLRLALPTLKAEYYAYWLNSDHLVHRGLSRYHAPSCYPAESIPAITIDHEATWDLSPRFEEEDVLALLPVDLNSNLFAYENNFAYFYGELGEHEVASEWSESANRRAVVMNQLMWDEEDGLYYDYNYLSGERKKIKSLATFLPLFHKLADIKRASRISNNLALFEKSFGLVACDETYGYSDRQWNFPVGWAPLHWFTYRGLNNYGFHESATRIALKWLNLNLEVWRRTGKLFEKYDVVTGSHQVLEDRYKNQEGFGWTWSARLEMCQWRRETLDKESIWDEERSTSLSRW